MFSRGGVGANCFNPIIYCHRLNCDVYLGDVMGSVLMCIFHVD